jgi:hypothetical protein
VTYCPGDTRTLGAGGACRRLELREMNRRCLALLCLASPTRRWAGGPCVGQASHALSGGRCSTIVLRAGLATYPFAASCGPFSARQCWSMNARAEVACVLSVSQDALLIAATRSVDGVTQPSLTPRVRVGTGSSPIFPGL